MKTPLKEAVKELIRVLIVSLPSLILLILQYIEPETALTLTALLRGLEKLAHETNKHIEGNYPELPF